MNKWLLRKLLTIGLFIFASIVIECFLFVRLGFGFFPTYFLLDIALILFFAGIIFLLKINWFQDLFVSLVLLIQTVIAFTNICMSDALNDVFTFDMLNLVDETARVLNLDMLPLWPLIFYLVFFAMVVAGLLLLRKIKVNGEARRSILHVYIRNMSVLLLTACTIAYSLCSVTLPGTEKDDLYFFSDHVLYNTFSSSRQSLMKFGSWGFYFEEFFRRFYVVDVPVQYTKAELNAFVNASEYDPTSLSLYGLAEDNNVVVVMMESMEWYAISSEITPTLYALANGYNFGSYTDDNDSANDYLNFNFYDFSTDNDGFISLKRKDYDYNNATHKYSPIAAEPLLDDSLFGTYGLSLTNYYSKAKTDYSEDSVILGNYPYNKSFTSHGGILGYGAKGIYDDLDYNFSLPNVLKSQDAVDVANYMHSYLSSFYGRNQLIPQFGFDNALFLDDMPASFPRGESLAHIALDSKMLDYNLYHSSTNFMPKDKRFLSFFTTVTTHGEYSENPLLTNNYEFIDSVDYLGKNENGTISANISEDVSSQVRTYLASVLDLEYTMTIMLKYLMENNLFDKTVIVLYADHQSYYDGIDLNYKSLYFSDKAGEFSSPIEWERDNTYGEIYGPYNQDRYKVPAIIYSTKINDSVVGSGGDAHYVDKLTCSFDLTVTIFTLLGVDYSTNYYMGYPVICSTVYDSQKSAYVELGVRAIISSTGYIFNKQFNTEDGTMLLYSRKNADIYIELQDFSYDVIGQLEKWYKISALYEYDMFQMK